MNDEPVLALRISTDGSAEELHAPDDVDTAIRQVGSMVDVAPVAGYRYDGHRLLMYVDDCGHMLGLPVNPVATELYGTGFPIVGDAVLIDDDYRPLPNDLVGRLRPVDELDWDDHLDAREREPTEADLGGPVIDWDDHEPSLRPDSGLDLA